MHRRFQRWSLSLSMAKRQVPSLAIARHRQSDRLSGDYNLRVSMRTLVRWSIICCAVSYPTAPPECALSRGRRIWSFAVKHATNALLTFCASPLLKRVAYALIPISLRHNKIRSELFRAFAPPQPLSQSRWQHEPYRQVPVDNHAGLNEELTGSLHARTRNLKGVIKRHSNDCSIATAENATTRIGLSEGSSCKS